MLVTYTNASGVSQWVSTLRRSVDPAASFQVRRTTAQMDAEQGDKVKIQAGTITVTFTSEPGDTVPAPAPSLSSCTNATRPAANAVGIYTAVFNTDDGAPNWTDGVNWRDSAGNIT